MTISVNDENIALQTANAIDAGDAGDLSAALEAFQEDTQNKIYEKMKLEFLNEDESVLKARGYKVLTYQEKKFYDGFAKALKSSNPMQALTDLVSDIDNGMPETIIIDVFRELVESRPLLAAVNFQYVKYLSRVLLNDHSAQSALWGDINDAITREILTSFRSQEITLQKLSAFVAIPNDMLELGHSFIDNYMRTILKDSTAKALEEAIITGTGNKMPIGLDRDVSDGVTVTGGVYPQKPTVELKGFSPELYGAVLVNFAKTERGFNRTFGEVTLLCNQSDYFTKIMPASTLLNVNGQFINNVFPYPTNVIVSNAVPDGEAILAILPEYFIGIGNDRAGVLETSEHYRFLEDQTVIKTRMFANGRAMDNTVSQRLDISSIEPAYITVKNLPTV